MPSRCRCQIRGPACPVCGFAKNLPHAGASASNSLQPKDLFLGESFANLRFVQFGSHRRAFDMHSRQCLLDFGGCLQFDTPPLRFLGKTESQSFPPRIAVTKNWRGPMKQELFLSSSASCWSIGEQQLAIKGSVSLRNFCQPSVRSVLFDGPATAQALARTYEAGAMPVIASIILLALIVAAVGGGGVILARRFMSLLDISAASSLLGTDWSVAALTEQGMVQMQPSARITASGSRAAPAQAVEPAILTPAVLAPLPAVLAPLPAVPKRPLPPAGPLSSESTVLVLVWRSARGAAGGSSVDRAA